MAVWFVLHLSGCAVYQQPVDSSKKAYGHTTQLVLPEGVFETVAVESEHDIFTLDDVQKQQFLAFFYAAERQHVPSHKRLYEYLEASIEGFHYRGETYNARHAYHSNEGNCLSLAILTTSLAKLAGLEVEYQKVNAPPVYQRHGDLLTISSHVRTFVYQSDFESPDGSVVLRKPRMVIDYFPQRGNISGGQVTYHDFVSMYYQNLAAEAMVENENHTAYSLLKRAHTISPRNPETLNSLAVLHRRAGYENAALQIYRYAQQHSAGSVNLISNFATLLEKQGDKDGAANLRESIQHIEDDNPYQWLDIGEAHLSKGELRLATKYFSRAVENAPYLHEGHFGLAKAYLSLGKTGHAHKALKKAYELAAFTPEQHLYQAKLSILETRY